MTASSHRISKEKLLQKMYTKHTVGTLFYTKYCWLQKCTLFCWLATFLMTFTNCGHILCWIYIAVNKCTSSLYMCQHHL